MNPYLSQNCYGQMVIYIPNGHSGAGCKAHTKDSGAYELSSTMLVFHYRRSDGETRRRARPIRDTVLARMKRPKKREGRAKSIAAIAGMAGKPGLTSEYCEKSERLRQLILQRLWNRDAAFFETCVESGGFAPVRDNIGFTPWYFYLPEPSAEFDAAWKQLIDPEGFYAPHGPTTAERRNPQFQIPYEGDDCQWNGPSWPLSTTITLRMANVINRKHRSAISKDDYFHVFEIYSRTQRLKLEDGRTVPFIDEDLNPLTGDWLARATKIRKKTFYGRGDHYNHSAYADLVVAGLAGLRPRADSTVEVNPPITAKWDWFCLDRVPYHGRSLTILWGKSGAKFHKGKGLRVFADAKEIAYAADLGRVTGALA